MDPSALLSLANRNAVSDPGEISQARQIAVNVAKLPELSLALTREAEEDWER